MDLVHCLVKALLVSRVHLGDRDGLPAHLTTPPRPAAAAAVVRPADAQQTAGRQAGTQRRQGAVYIRGALVRQHPSGAGGGQQPGNCCHPSLREQVFRSWCRAGKPQRQVARHECARAQDAPQRQSMVCVLPPCCVRNELNGKHL